MHRAAASILLLAGFVLYGTGALRHVHDLAHLHADEAGAHHEHDHPSPPPVHGDWDCELHGLLNAPLSASAALPLLILLGLFVAFLTQVPVSVRSVRPLLRLDCRGPPAC